MNKRPIPIRPHDTEAPGLMMSGAIGRICAIIGSLFGEHFFDEQIWDGTEHILPTDESERLAARNKQFHQPTIYT